MKRLAPLLLLLPCLYTPARAQAEAMLPSAAEVARQADELLDQAYPARGPGGAVLVARGDTVLYRAARGEADIDRHVPLEPDALFRIGSVSKQFAAAGLLTLVEAGKVSLDDPLSKYVADFPGGEGITVEQLLNHTSGVKSYTAIPGYMDGPIRKDLSTAQMVDVFRRQPPDFAPGTQWAYSNSGYVLVGAVIEAASGQPWHAYLQRVLFEPLGMRDTGYGHDPEFAARQVKGYTFDGDKAVPMRPLSMTQPHAAGGLVSNVDDLLKWNRALHEGRVLKNDSYVRMITPVGAAAAKGIEYGFGISRDRVRNQDQLQHGGGIFGFISQLAYVPGPDITVAVLENDDNDVSDGASVLARKLAAIALGQPYPELRPIAVAAAQLRAAEGVYRFEGDITRVLRMVDGRLTAQRSGGKRADLVPIAADDFLYADGFNRLQLLRDAAGAISGIRFFANGEGDGVVGSRTDDALPAEPVAVQLPRAALERLVGAYSGGGMIMKVFVDGESLQAQLPDQPPVHLEARSTTVFQVRETPEAIVEFGPGDAPPQALVLRQNGRELEFKRTP
ncbi:serine hydrolase domain-containing protein [Agrilutibacter solisilvae]|uniref:Beta-lactamase family protein n=1 Tax=Agrilutibacter solisilvae TaxID=2763317 RepID=A0A974Y5W5_9GAMM|nr:serine hydrolase domain-containing protein [Lysobacter solisilvae]QSX79081.1 beta-lactamase family protein [Lysobacter solisilvae]